MNQTDLERLERARSENSDWIEELERAVDELGAHLKKVFPGNRNYLPRRIHFYNKPDKGFEIMRPQDSGGWELTDKRKPVEAMLKLSDEIRNGWLKEVAELLEQHTQKIKSAAKTIQAHTETDLVLTS
ncbi:MAG TPA: hypothetical protein VJH94_04725 [Candidatus Paceibacterota bacterium]